MNFNQSVTTCLGKYATFSGRASRSEFWWFQLFMLLLIFFGMFIDFLLGTSEQDLFVSFVNLGITLPAFAVSARRLHDIGKSGWWNLIFLTGIGLLLLLYWWVQPSLEDGKEGHAPLSAETQQGGEHHQHDA
jgi:uncharacterized membrane protein YhaH (DUF805 family)